MHQFRNSRTLLRLVLIAALEWLKWLSSLVSLYLLIRGRATDDRGMLMAGLAVLGLAVSCQLIAFVMGRFTRCPLCMVPVLGHSSCRKHKRSKRFLGSTRLKVCWDVLTSDRISCPFCNEKIDTRNSRR